MTDTDETQSLSLLSECLETRFAARIAALAAEILDEATRLQLEVWGGGKVPDDYVHGRTPLESALRAFNDATITFAARSQDAARLLHHEHVYQPRMGRVACVFCGHPREALRP